jgi:hypothetical protein
LRSNGLEGCGSSFEARDLRRSHLRMTLSDHTQFILLSRATIAASKVSD